MSEYLISVTLTNETEGHRFAHFTEPIEDWLLRDDGTPDTGAIYRLLQSDYGRCQSSLYVETGSGVQRVGWYFVSRQSYEDCADTYLRGAWCTLGKEVEPARPRRLERVAI